MLLSCIIKRKNVKQRRKKIYHTSSCLKSISDRTHRRPGWDVECDSFRVWEGSSRCRVLEEAASDWAGYRTHHVAVAHYALADSSTGLAPNFPEAPAAVVVAGSGLIPTWDFPPAAANDFRTLDLVVSPRPCGLLAAFRLEDQTHQPCH